MSTAVLLLNADHTPIKVISWEKAVYLILDRKAHIVADYAGRVIRSANMEMAWPAVVALSRYVSTKNKIRFNRSNLLARDAYTCQYCGDRPRTATKTPKLDELTIDHVVPRAHSRQGMVTLPWNGKSVSVTCWENVVAACFDCNSRKADRTPAQAGLTLRSTPKKPSPWDAVRMSLTRTKVPDEWKDYIPHDSAWRDYWDVELEPS
jgi:5-methylcytosine-specific restriction endonuclease McrA